MISPGLGLRGQISDAKRHGPAAIVNMQAAAAQAFHIKGVCVLKSHCRNGKAVRFDSAEESIHIAIVPIAATLLLIVGGRALPPAGYKVAILDMGSTVILTA